MKPNPLPPPPLPKAYGMAIAPHCNMLAARAVSCHLKPDGFLLLTYQLDDGDTKSAARKRHGAGHADDNKNRQQWRFCCEIGQLAAGRRCTRNGEPACKRRRHHDNVSGATLVTAR